MIKDKRGGLWIHTSGGVDYFNTQSETFSPIYRDSANKTVVFHEVYCLYQDRDSNIWAGTENEGLFIWNPLSDRFTKYTDMPADTSITRDVFIIAIGEGDAADLWIGTNEGINKLNRHTGKLTNYLPGVIIFCIYRDAGGIIWIGTSNGIFHYNQASDAFDSYVEEISGNTINIGVAVTITGDKEDNLWIGSESGIYMLNKKRDQIIHYGKEYGIPEANAFFNVKSSLLKQDGELYFGDQTGYYAFYPDKLKITSDKTRLHFTRFWLANKEIFPGKASPLQVSLFDTKEIRLNHDQNVFSFSATFINFRNLGEKKIYYRLDNYDNEWRTGSPEERVQYFKVPYGNYTLHIKTANDNTGEWIEKTILIRISPPWWTTWWAYAVYALLFIGAVASVHHYQKERLIKAERERARIKELAQAKEIEKAYHELKVTQTKLIQSEKMASLGELTAGIAHEIQNPLNFVNNFSETNTELLEEAETAFKAGNPNEGLAILADIKANERKVNQHGKRADAIVKSMLEHSRSSKGEEQLTDVNALIDEYLRLAYHGFSAKDESFNATLETHLDKGIGKINIVPQDIGRVVLNLFNNAFYAVNEMKNLGIETYEPKVGVTSKRVNGKVEITVRDNGTGIPQDKLDKIFQPFFTTKPTGEGTGLGLSLSYDIVKAHNGELQVQSIEGEGAIFIIQLPA